MLHRNKMMYSRWVGGALNPHTLCLFSGQEDEVVLQCIANIHKEQRKFCLAAEGLGNRLCFLEPTSEAKVRSRACPIPSPAGFPCNHPG